MGETAGTKGAPHQGPICNVWSRVRASHVACLAPVWGFLMSVLRHPWARPVVLVLLTMFQLVLLWLLGQMVELCLSLMEVWLELAAKHLEITLDTTS